MASDKAEGDMIDRGNKQANHAGTATFVGLRTLDPFLQYTILSRNVGSSLIAAVGGSTLPHGPALITNTPFDRLGLSPYRSILFGMGVAAALKQSLHVVGIMQESVSVQMGITVGFANALMDSLNSLAFICAQTSASVNGEHFPQTPLIVGSILFCVGLTTEVLSEVQRHVFKKAPANKGKLYKGGLFGLARHINYLGYTAWRAGFALAAGGWTWGAVIASLSLFQFINVVIPQHEQYLSNRYSVQYEDYKRAVRYRYIPLLW